MTRHRKHKGGRPLKIDATLLGKLEDAFSNGFTDEMACLYANINPDTLYEYQKRNPKFTERKELLKQSPNLVAQKTLVKDAATTQGARWWAEHRMPDFMPKTKVEHSGKIQHENLPLTPEQQMAVKAYEDEMKKQIKEKSKQLQG